MRYLIGILAIALGLAVLLATMLVISPLWLVWYIFHAWVLSFVDWVQRLCDALDPWDDDEGWVGFGVYPVEEEAITPSKQAKPAPTKRIVIIMDAVPCDPSSGSGEPVCNMRVTVTSSVDVATAERLFAMLPGYLGELREKAVEYVKRMTPPVGVRPMTWDELDQITNLPPTPFWCADEREGGSIARCEQPCNGNRCYHD